MLSKARQRKYFDKRWESLYKHFGLFFISQNPEELHRMRVEIKKINALLFFVQAGEKNSLKKIFKHDGLIRNTQVNLQLITNYKIADNAFKKEQQQLLINESKRF